MGILPSIIAPNSASAEQFMNDVRQSPIGDVQPEPPESAADRAVIRARPRVRYARRHQPAGEERRVELVVAVVALRDEDAADGIRDARKAVLIGTEVARVLMKGRRKGER